MSLLLLLNQPAASSSGSGVLKVRLADGTWRNIGCGGITGDVGRLNLWDGTQWVQEACTNDSRVGAHPLKVWDGTAWKTVACMLPLPVDGGTPSAVTTAVLDGGTPTSVTIPAVDGGAP